MAGSSAAASAGASVAKAILSYAGQPLRLWRGGRWQERRGCHELRRERYEVRGVKSLRRLVPLQRMGTEAECSAAIVFLLSEAAAFVSGACLRVDGGAPNARASWPMPEQRRSRAYRGFPLESTPDFLRDET